VVGVTEEERPRVSRREEGLIPAAVEPAEWWLDQIEASAELVRVASRCPHCRPTVQVVSRYPDSNMPRALGVSHERGCPEYVDEEDDG
jgi:hypothetical protein